MFLRHNILLIIIQLYLKKQTSLQVDPIGTGVPCCTFHMTTLKFDVDSRDAYVEIRLEIKLRCNAVYRKSSIGWARLRPGMKQHFCTH